MSRPILIDGRSLQDRSAVRGIGTYVRGLLGGLSALHAVEDVAVVLQRGREHPSELRDWGISAGPTIPVLKRRIQPIVDHLLVMRAVAQYHPALYHAVEYAQPLASRVPVVVTVHDVVQFLFPQHYPWTRLERTPGLHLVRRADAILANSACTARDVARIAHVAPEKITVTHLGVNSIFSPAADDRIAAVRALYGIDRDYIMTVGVFEPRKRLNILLETTQEIRKHHDVALLIVGEQAHYASRVAHAVQDAGLESCTYLIGYAPLDDLVVLYSGSRCFVFTSAYEGFGLPLLEAMSCGTPVAAFANSCIPEVTGGAAALAPDGDARTLADITSTVLASEETARSMRKSGRKQAAQFTWEKTAAQTLAVYRQLY